MRQRLPGPIFFSLAFGVALTACTSSSAADIGSTPGTETVAHWVKFRHIPQVVDLASGGRDGSLFVAARGRLFILLSGGSLKPYARGPHGYKTAIGPEPYFAVTGNERVAGTRCSFGSGTIFALQPTKDPGVIRIGTNGHATRFATLPAVGMLSGIAFDSTGHFGHDLLVTHRSPSGVTTVLAFDCMGHVRTITSRGPAVEGGMAVAPASFGRYGGDLIAPNERNGLIYAIRPDGTVATVAVSGLPHGGDVGVEGEGFVPPGFNSRTAAYLSDRFSRGSPHPGTDSLLRLSASALLKAGVRAGDLLVATEASARTIVVRCANSCTVRFIAMGPAITHAEGHIAFGR
jgi:hypothetical protein